MNKNSIPFNNEWWSRNNHLENKSKSNKMKRTKIKKQKRKLKIFTKGWI
jgi:hypothetical protein